MGLLSRVVKHWGGSVKKTISGSIAAAPERLLQWTFTSTDYVHFWAVSCFYNAGLSHSSQLPSSPLSCGIGEEHSGGYPSLHRSERSNCFIMLKRATLWQNMSCRNKRSLSSIILVRFKLCRWFDISVKKRDVFFPCHSTFSSLH